MPITSGEALRQAAARIGMTDARVLLCHVLGCTHAGLVAHPERLLNDAENRFLDIVARRERGEPVAYLTGTREFYSRAFSVNAAVLIPRPETELLVELALERLPVDTGSRVLDLGTGSGCIAVTIALERPHAIVVAADASRDALAIATDNARRLGADGVRFRQGDWYGAVAGERFDLIVANPPYVAAGDPHLAAGDVRFEPVTALVSGHDGLDAVRCIADRAPDFLVPGGWLLLEHGYDQGEPCRRILGAAGLANVATWPDLSGIGRVTGGRLD